MKLEQDKLYHIYNQGNNREQIFYNSENYLYFLRKFRQFVLPHCDVLAYCLMPNHFHFLINSNEKSVETVQIGGISMNKVTNGFRLLLSDYAQKINDIPGINYSTAHTNVMLIHAKAFYKSVVLTK